MEAVRRLKDAHQRLEVEAVGHDSQFGDWPLEPVHTEQARRAEHGQPVKRVISEVAIIG